MTDPFGDLEQQVEEIKTVAKKEKEAVGDKTEAVGTIKGGAGFDSPWLVIHAADVSDLRAVLVEDADEIVDILEGLWKASLKFQSFGAVAGKQQAARKAAGAQSVSEVLSQAPPAGASDAPGGEVRHCKHGQMVYRAGIAKGSGKPYRVFGCPHPVRAEQCAGQFLNS